LFLIPAVYFTQASGDFDWQTAHTPVRHSFCPNRSAQLDKEAFRAPVVFRFFALFFFSTLDWFRRLFPPNSLLCTSCDLFLPPPCICRGGFARGFPPQTLPRARVLQLILRTSLIFCLTFAHPHILKFAFVRPEVRVTCVAVGRARPLALPFFFWRPPFRRFLHSPVAPPKSVCFLQCPGAFPPGLDLRVSIQEAPNPAHPFGWSSCVARFFATGGCSVYPHPISISLPFSVLSGCPLNVFLSALTSVQPPLATPTAFFPAHPFWSRQAPLGQYSTV